MLSYLYPAVGKAFGVLNDTEKRRRYDVYGSEAERAPLSNRRSHHSHNGYQYEFDGKLMMIVFYVVIK